MTALCLSLTLQTGFPQEPSVPVPDIQGIRGVNQEAAASVKNVEPPAVKPVTIPAAQGVKKVDGVETIKSVKATAPDAVQGLPPPPPAGAALKQDAAESVKMAPPDSVKSVPPPSSTHAVGAVRAVKGVNGIAVAKQRNLEAALLIKEDTKTRDRKGKAAAAALLRAPGKGPTIEKNEDSRAAFQEFAKQTAPGS